MFSPLEGVRRTTIILSCLGACALPLFVASCGRGDARESRPDRVLPSVEAVQARHGALPLSDRLSGVVRARNQFEVYPEITGIVTEVLVHNGDSVRVGEPLVRFRDSEFRQRLKQAEASLRIALAQRKSAEATANEARTELGRLRSLADSKLASQAELDASVARNESAEAEVELAKARVEQSQASVEELKENLAKTVVRAPIAGNVGNRNAEIGMLADSGTRLFTLGQLDSVEVEIVLTDRMLGYIEEGQRTEISTGNGVLSAPLTRISPFLHPVTHSTEAQIDLANPGARLKPGMFVTVEVFYGESEQATLVPLSALYEQPATGTVGVYITRASLDLAPEDETDDPEPAPLTDPVAFEFVAADMVAQGRLEAAIRGVDPGTWVVTVGQNLLGEEKADARVRPVKWERVERLERLQREDLMKEVIERQASW